MNGTYFETDNYNASIYKVCSVYCKIYAAYKVTVYMRYSKA